MFIFCLHICFFELQYQDPVSSCKALCKCQHAQRSLLFHACKLLPLCLCIGYISAEEQKHSTDAFKTFVSPANARKKRSGERKIVTGRQICRSKNGTCTLLPRARQRWANKETAVLRGVSCKRRGWKERKTPTSWRDETRRRPLSRGAIPRVSDVRRCTHNTAREERSEGGWAVTQLHPDGLNIILAPFQVLQPPRRVKSERKAALSRCQGWKKKGSERRVQPWSSKKHRLVRMED